jgi:hypothetical protein
VKRLALLAAALSLLVFGADRSISQTGEFRTLTIATTADTVIDSSLTANVMDNKRIFINGIYYWYDNAANTNNFNIDIVSGQSAIAVQGTRRNLRYGEAMLTSGIVGKAILPNITTQADSTIYVSVSATGSDSILVVINYRFVGK